MNQENASVEILQFIAVYCIISKLEHIPKAYFPIASTDSPIVILLNALHSSKAQSSMILTELGRTKEVRLIQPENTLLPIFSTEFPIVRSVSDVNDEKALSPIVLTESGMCRDIKLVQARKAL